MKLGAFLTLSDVLRRAVWSIIQSSLFVRLQGTQVTEEENSDPGIAVGKQTDTLTIQ